MKWKDWVALAASTVLAICADAAQAQRSSTMEERLFLSYNGKPIGEWPDGHFIGHYQASTPQQCRDMCLANKQCRYWYWTVPGRYAATPATDKSCTLLAGILKAEPGEGDRGNYAGRVSDRPSTAATPPIPSPPPSAAAPPAATPSVLPPSPVPTGQLFPLPRPGLEIVFRVSAANDPNIDRYASFKVLGNSGHSARIRRRAWEGPLDNPIGGADETVDFVFDEVPMTPTGTCQLEASDRELRQVFVGADFLYKRDCETSSSNGHKARFKATISRTVERGERVTVPAGTFDAIVVKKITNTHSVSINAAGVEHVHEFTESETLSWWVPALGLYVKQQSRSRTIDRWFAPETADAYRRDGIPLPPRTTDWGNPTQMVAIIVR